MIQQWKKDNIDLLINEIQKYYDDCCVNYFQHSYAIEKLNQEELKYFNDNFKITETFNPKKNILLEILDDESKDNFSFFLIYYTQILLNGKDKNNQTVFIKLAKKRFKSENYFNVNLLLKIFQRGYTVIPEDEEFILDLYKKIEKQKDLEKWSGLRFIQKLNNTEQIELALQKERELFVILSYKLGKPIYFNFPNLLGVSNSAIQHYRESGDIILKAMETYKRTQKIQNLDIRKGTFKRKLNDYYENKPIQDKKFEIIVKKLFKEIK